MHPLSRTALVLATACTAALGTATATEKAPAPAAARFYPLVGKWTGSGALGAPGQPATELSLNFRCRKVSAGAAVLCELRADGKDMRVRETDLFGVDSATGRGRWYAVTNMGETHEHAADWPDARTMKAHLAWTQEGKRMEENITLRFATPRSLEFASVVTQEGRQVGSFTGLLKR
jgi:hypothetical protein